MYVESRTSRVRGSSAKNLLYPRCPFVLGQLLTLKTSLFSLLIELLIVFVLGFNLDSYKNDYLYR
jgi:hypothetical protein